MGALDGEQVRDRPDDGRVARLEDALHALVEATADDSDLRRFVSMFKQRSAFLWRRTGGGVLWQEGYYEHVLRNDQAYPPIVAYILQNPLRAKLCATLSEYPYLGSDRYSLEQLVDVVSVNPRST